MAYSVTLLISDAAVYGGAKDDASASAAQLVVYEDYAVADGGVKDDVSVIGVDDALREALDKQCRRGWWWLR